MNGLGKYVAPIVALLVGIAHADRIQGQELPSVPKGFHVSIFAKEPLVRHPCAMAFDAKGRLVVSLGQQYRHPKPNTPGDRITILIDTNGDGVADQAKTFAEGFNHIQGLAWHGKDLWVANAPDLTVVRDLDGDDQADEYVLIYGGLGNLEHALHGLNFGPDGMLYMSKGNSKGYMKKSSPELRLAPKAFADLWGIPYPSGIPAIPKPQVFRKGQYKRGYHHPNDDWGREGGILRCDPKGQQLEIVSRGMRNPWDIAFDENFDWLGTDQDQDGGDRIIRPFLGAHFGWGHPWSPHWTGKDHLPTVPISGPLFHGSGTGVVYCASENFPEKYRGVFFVNDWLRRKTYVYRPRWKGAMLRNMTGPEVFASAPSGRSMGASSGLLFDPTDIEVGPDGALWILSWGHGYGAKIQNGKQVDKGRVYRITFGKRPLGKLSPHRNKPHRKWTVKELINDLRHDRLPVWRTNAQLELIRRGNKVKQDLLAALKEKQLALGAATWIALTLGSLELSDGSVDRVLAKRAAKSNLVDRIQALRIFGFRGRRKREPLPTVVAKALQDQEPRIRFAAIQAIHTAREKRLLKNLWRLATNEKDRITFYATWRALGELEKPAVLRKQLTSTQGGVRLAALLALLEGGARSGDEAAKLRLDKVREVAEIASSFVEKAGTSAAPVIEISPTESEFTGSTNIVLGTKVRGAHVRYTLDGTEPTDTSGRRYDRPLKISKNTVLHVALFQGRVRIGPVIRREFRQSGSGTLTGADVVPVEITDVLAKSGNRYSGALLRLGGEVYTNRHYGWLDVPDSFVGHTVIQTSNEDADVGSRGDKFLQFSLPEDAIVQVAHDRRIAKKPKWLSRFERSNLSVRSSDTTFDLYRRRFSKGNVVLGGNTTDGKTSGQSQYAVIVTPAPLVKRARPTKIAEALSRLQSAKTSRGRRLFFGEGSCGNCHRLGDKGNAFAPNLSNMGERAAPKIIAESILKPNAVITEGFHGLAVLTKSGKIYSGFIRKESGLVVELVEGTGKVVVIPRKEIAKRKRLETSVMPATYANLLGPQHVADLIAFITAHKGDSKKKAVGFSIEKKQNQLDIFLDGKRIAAFVFRHNKVKRSFFAHVKTPTGIQVTRNFPPIKGKDSTDHATMHPGIWLGFANLNGMTFWHNKEGVVVHKGFQGKLVVGKRAEFKTIDEYRTAKDKLVCRQKTTYTFERDPDGYRIVVDASFSSPKQIVFGVREEMGLGVRVASPIRVRQGNGSILSSTGGKNGEGTWGKFAKWWDYSGTINGRKVGMMVMSAPGNPKVWSHSRDYGLLVGNPFPVDLKPNRNKKLIVRPGKEFRLQYGVLVHDHAPKVKFDRGKAYRRFVKSTE